MTGRRRGDEDLRARLLDELEAVRRTLDAAAAAATGLLADQCRLDGPPPSGTRREQEALADVGARERRRLTDLLDALRRLARGDYGACSRCGGTIEEERLEVLPATERCAACADA